MTGPLRHRGPANMAEKKKRKKNDMYEFPRVYDCTREQNASPYFPLIVRQCK